MCTNTTRPGYGVMWRADSHMTQGLIKQTSLFSLFSFSIQWAVFLCIYGDSIEILLTHPQFHEVTNQQPCTLGQGSHNRSAHKQHTHDLHHTHTHTLHGRRSHRKCSSPQVLLVSMTANRREAQRGTVVLFRIPALCCFCLLFAKLFLPQGVTCLLVFNDFFGDRVR